MTSDSPPLRLVLASTSRYRGALLDRLGVPFEARAHRVDERAVTGLTPDALAVRLARDKAESVAADYAGAPVLIIGSDQVVDLDGDCLGKPGDAARALAQLERLQGRAHRLVTAVAVHDVAAGTTRHDVDVHTLTMRALDRAALARYVAHDEPYDCAGAYVLERRGVALFEHIAADPELADDTAIIGLPVIKTLALLRQAGFDILSA